MLCTHLLEMLHEVVCGMRMHLHSWLHAGMSVIVNKPDMAHAQSLSVQLHSSTVEVFIECTTVDEGRYHSKPCTRCSGPCCMLMICKQA